MALEGMAVSLLDGLGSATVQKLALPLSTLACRVDGCSVVKSIDDFEYTDPTNGEVTSKQVGGAKFFSCNTYPWRFPSPRTSLPLDSRQPYWDTHSFQHKKLTTHKQRVSDLSSKTAPVSFSD